MLNNVFEPLPLQDIEEKIELNKQQWGHDLYKLKQLLEFELSLIERGVLRSKWEFMKSTKSYQELINDILSSEIQIQNLKEQIRHIQNKILRDIINV